MKAIMIVICGVVSAILYGIALDQITVRVCVEYFTVGHPRIFPTESPTLLALGWGVVASWWAGLLLGIPLAIAARAGMVTKREPRSLVRPIALLFIVMAFGAVISGLVGFVLARMGFLELNDELAATVPTEHHAAFLSDGAAHLASYALGFVGGAIVIVSVWRSRTNRKGPLRTT